MSRLPESLRPLFAEREWTSLALARDARIVAARVLVSGTWEDITWLRRRLGDEEVSRLIVDGEGLGLSAKQLRFWELIFDLPSRLVDEWGARPAPARHLHAVP